MKIESMRKLRDENKYTMNGEGRYLKSHHQELLLTKLKLNSLRPTVYLLKVV
jgi:hypothetical protein